jgi:hypothetical protein
VFENSVLRKVFGPKRNEAMEDQRKLHNEELHKLVEHVARIGRSIMHTLFTWELQKKRDYRKTKTMMGG